MAKCIRDRRTKRDYRRVSDAEAAVSAGRTATLLRDYGTASGRTFK